MPVSRFFSQHLSSLELHSQNPTFWMALGQSNGTDLPSYTIDMPRMAFRRHI